MSLDVHPHLLRAAVAAFVIALPAMQWLAFRSLARRGGDVRLLASRNVRDHVLGALGWSAAGGAGVFVPALAAWAFRARAGLGWDVLTGIELFAAFLVLDLGFTAAAVRFCLDLAGRMDPPRVRSAVPVLRLAVLASAAAYGAALWISSPGGPARLLLAVFVLGGALVAMGLNRTAEMSPDLLARLARALGK